MSSDNINVLENESLPLESQELLNESVDAAPYLANAKIPASPIDSSETPDIDLALPQVDFSSESAVNNNSLEQHTDGEDDNATQLHIDSSNDELPNDTITEEDTVEVDENDIQLNANNQNTDETISNIGKKIKLDHKSEKISQFPLGRIRDIMKADPDINIVSGDCVFLVGKATEMFLQRLGKEIHAVTLRNKKKTLQKRDLDAAISENPAFEFLEGALD